GVGAVRIEEGGAQEARDRVVGGTHGGGLGSRMIVVIDGRSSARQPLYRGGETAFELVVVVAVKQIVLAIVLVVQHALDFGEPMLEQLVLGCTLRARAVGIAAPGDVGAGEIVGRLPAALVAHGLPARS